MNKNDLKEFFEAKKPYILLSSILVFSFVFFGIAIRIQSLFSELVSDAEYLTWHNIFEGAAILVSFTIFVITYYTYNLTNRFRAILFGALFLTVGLIDFFHMFSFKGMPPFFVENVTANRATTFWVAARLIASLGFVLLSFISPDIKVIFNKRFYLIPSLFLSIAIFITVTYFPGLYPPMFLEGKGLTEIKKNLEYVIMALLAIAAIKYFYDYIKKKDYMSVLICGAMLVSIFSEYSFIRYSQIYDIFNYIGHIYKVVSYYMLFRIIFVRNVRKPYLELFEAQTKLRNYADSLDKIVDQRTMQLKRINKRLMDDLDYARDIQKAMLPVIIPEVENLTFHSMYYPAERLSGDFYDIFKVDDEHIGFYICDVSGHGVPAAMLTVFLKQCIETRREADINSDSFSFPSSVLHGIFDSFNNTNFKDEVYMVLIYAIYNINTKKLIYCSAGMNVAPLLIKKDGTMSELPVNGLPICKVKELYDVEYIDSYVELQDGDKLMFYTDGLIDANNIEKQPYTAERLFRVLAANAKEPGKEMLEILKQDLYSFIDGKKIIDDITFFIIDIDKSA